MAGAERAVVWSGLPARERRLLWLTLCFRTTSIGLMAGALLLTALSAIRELEHRWLEHDGWSVATASRCGDALVILTGGLLAIAGSWLLFQWLLRVPIGRLRIAVVRVEEGKP